MSVGYVYLGWIRWFFPVAVFRLLSCFLLRFWSVEFFLVEEGFRIGDTNSVIDDDSKEIKILVGIPETPILEIFVKFFDCYPQSSGYFELCFRGKIHDVDQIYAISTSVKPMTWHRQSDVEFHDEWSKMFYEKTTKM